MVTKRADISFIAGLCILLILAVSLAGCTGSNTPTNTPATPTAQPVPTSITTTSVLPSQTPAQTQVATPAKTETQTTVQAAQTQEKVSLTINSAQKQTKVNTIVPSAGRMFLVLDITVKNNAIEKGFDLTDDRITLNYARAGTATEKSITTQLRGGLDNPILMPTTIQQNDKRTGQVVFGVVDISNSFTLHLIDDRGTIISSASITV